MAGKTETKAKKAEIIKKFGQNAANTGSSEVQVALLTTRINELNQHFRANANDHAGRRGLLKLVGQRKRLLKYLKATDQGSYNQLIQKLELRK
jgi:small subunit ribosomal protein S15